jgi:hypothetical protein
MPTGIGPLATLQVQTLLEEILEDTPANNRLFLGRVPRVPAADEEIIARITGEVSAAELIADDQEAPVKSGGRIVYTSTKIPNLKHGRHFGQRQINLLERIEANAANAREGREFENYMVSTLRGLIRGVEDRMEMLLCSMATDSGTYDRFGIRLQDMTWGMPADLKVTAATPWSNPASTPVTDIQTVVANGRVRGVVYDRITMSTTAFRNMTRSTEFRNQMELVTRINVAVGNTALLNDTLMVGLAQQVLNLTIELYDGVTNVQAYSGAIASERFLPENKVVLTSAAFDNDADVWDFANGIVTETQFYNYVDLPFGTFDGPTEGPVGYATLADSRLNPPGIILWAVARGFPRKKNPAASACLTVG